MESGSKLQYLSNHTKSLYRNPLKKGGRSSTITTSVSETTKTVEKTESE